MKPEMLLTLTSTERYLGITEDPLKYIPDKPIPRWSWDGPPETSEGEINGFAARSALRPVCKDEESNGCVYCITCESSEALRYEIKEHVRFLVDTLRMQLVREGFMGDVSYELKWTTYDPSGQRGELRIVFWVRRKISGEVYIFSRIGDPREDTFKWVEKMDALMVPTIQKYTVPLLLGISLGAVGLAYYVSR